MLEQGPKHSSAGFPNKAISPRAWVFALLLSHNINMTLILSAPGTIASYDMLHLECGGKMHLREGQFEKAHTDFFEAFKNYDESGNAR